MGIKTYSKARDGAVKLSEHFTVGEFACRDGTDAVPVSEELVTLLQKIRDHFGRAVTVNSAYRTAAYNTKVGGAKRSQHLLGTAADITLAGVTPLEVAQYAEFLQPKAGGIGVYRTFTHVDVRAARSRWDSRSGKEMVVSGWPGNSETSEAEEAVAWAAAQGILRGDGGDLMLDQPLTRRQAAMVLHRLARLLGKA